MAEFPLLTIDCAGFQPRVALHRQLPSRMPDGEEDRPLASGCPAPGARSAAALLPLVRQIYQEAGIPPADTRAIAVTFGPGSFTSLRIGVTTAKMLAYCWQVPAIPIQTLDYLLLAAALSSPAWPSNQRWTAAINAYRQQCYCKLVQWSSQKPSDIALDLEPRWEQFRDHFSRDYASTQTFEAREVPEDSPRFQLNEDRFLKLESAFPVSVWTTQEATDARPLENWWTIAEQSERIVSTDVGILNENVELVEHTLVPANEAKDLAIAWLAAIQFASLTDRQLHPFQLQPIYYRPSAAEESFLSTRPR